VLLTPDPIVAQLLPMKLGPVENQPEGPARHTLRNQQQQKNAITKWKNKSYTLPNQ
jgi:hypothetical protein